MLYDEIYYQRLADECFEDLEMLLLIDKKKYAKIVEDIRKL